MSLVTGSRLGSYEILAPIGAGGMGEVYRARDSKLDRDVAIKVLPETFAQDSVRMVRFGREARLLAALDHPNIASIYGLEDSGNTHALVMQLAEGPTLADRRAQGPIPVDDALQIARQIADALEYAHERGIIHRDLKPANVKVASGDTVKILDFGLAKALESGPSAADSANSSTLSQMPTEAGVLLGTAAYMSPEQAKGKSVDRRADIWAFGCVLYEMLTGKTAFHGDTVTDTLAAVIAKEPDWSQLPRETPMRVRISLKRCLKKDPKQRLRDIGEARISLEEVLSGAPEGAPADTEGRLTKRRQPWLAWGIASVFALGMALFVFLYFHPTPFARQAMRFEIPTPENVTLGGGLALSPDGRNLAFTARGADGGTRVWVRSLETLEARPLDGTEGAYLAPFWSPDSRFIVFAAAGKLHKIAAHGGTPFTLCDVSVVYGGAWTPDDKIILGTGEGLLQVAASGGKPSLLTKVDRSHAEISHQNPSLLPDGHHFVYWRVSSQHGRGGIFLGSLDATPEKQSFGKVLADASPVVYAPALGKPSEGYLLFVRGAGALGQSGTLMAQPFNARSMELTGEAVPVAERVPGTGFSASPSGVLVYVTGPGAISSPAQGFIEGHLTWFDRRGKVLGVVGDRGVYRALALSPDQNRIAVERMAPQTESVDIWLHDLTRGVTTRLTFDDGWDSIPVWSPDGSRIAFGSIRSGIFDLYEKPSDLGGDDETLFKSSEDKVPSSWSPDGRYLLFFKPIPPNHVGLLSFGDARANPRVIPFSRAQFNEAAARFSPDGRWIAYTSSESGRREIYVRPFVAVSSEKGPASNRRLLSGKWMVSKDGGDSVLWRHDGKELFYLSPKGMAMAVDVSASGTFHAGIPKALFKVPRGVVFWDASSDGKRFLMTAPSAENSHSPFTVMVNWQSALKK